MGMLVRAIRIMVPALLIALPLGSVFADTENYNWPTWRGPNADGVAVQGNPPLTWSETKNIKWKVALPGSGDSTPVVWEDKIFVTTAVALGEEAPASSPPQGRRRGHGIRQLTVPYKFSLICLDRQTGKVLWDETVREEVPHEGHHPSSGLASYSAITDGEHVWVSFGSRGLHCYDLDGNHVWSADLIEMRYVGIPEHTTLTEEQLIRILACIRDGRAADTTSAEQNPRSTP